MNINFSLDESKYYDYQLDLINRTEQYVYVEAAPQIGKTVALLAYIILRALSQGPSKNHWWVAPAQKQANDAFEKCKSYIYDANLPSKSYNIKLAEKSIEFIGAGKIYFLTCENIYTLTGITVHTLVLDEAAFSRAEAWGWLLSRTAQTQAPVRCISNVAGKNNWYYKKCREAEQRMKDGDPNIFYKKLTVDEAIRVGIQSKEFIEILSKEYSKSVFNQIYYCIAIDEHESVFDYSSIMQSIIQKPEIFDVSIFAIDLGKKQDYTVITGLNWRKELVYYKRFKLPWIETEEIIKSLPDDVPIIIDQTGIGDPVFEHISSEKENVYGFIFSSKSKSKLVDSLVLSFNDGTLKILEQYSKEIINELMNFQLSLTLKQNLHYEAKAGYHDDIVMSLGMAALHFNDFVDIATPIVTAHNINVKPEQMTIDQFFAGK